MMKTKLKNGFILLDVIVGLTILGIAASLVTAAITSTQKSMLKIENRLIVERVKRNFYAVSELDTVKPETLTNVKGAEFVGKHSMKLILNGSPETIDFEDDK